MSTLVTQAPSVQHWLPGPARAIDAACPACGGLDSLVYSVGDRYVACLGCGWQRRLVGPVAGQAARIAVPTSGLPWRYLLTWLRRQPADPLPPVAALLWRQTGPATWQGPSRSTPDTTYTITRYPSGHVHCSCPHLGRGCWHRTRAAELGLEERATADGLF